MRKILIWNMFLRWAIPKKKSLQKSRYPTLEKHCFVRTIYIQYILLCMHCVVHCTYLT